MPLVKQTLSADIRALMAQLATNQDAADAQTRFVDGLTDAIDRYLRTATVAVSVTTVGSATAQAGTGTGALT